MSVASYNKAWESFKERYPEAAEVITKESAGFKAFTSAYSQAEKEWIYFLAGYQAASIKA